MPFGIFKRNVRKPPLLSVAMDGAEICVIRGVPVEEKPSVELSSRSPVLTFTDSSGCKQSHDLTSVVDEGCSWIHLSVRVSAGYACQADCLINDEERVDETALHRGEVKGIRFQPFYLPGCSGQPADLVGQGLFFRGLHFSGVITPGNVSASCICDFCQKSFRLQSFHAGFGNNAYFYCSKGPHTLVMSSYTEGAPAPLSHPDASALAKLEAHLPRCGQCGGAFRYLNPLLCPHCAKPFIDFARHPEIRDNEYYGNYLYGTTPQEWEEANQAPEGTARKLANPQR